MSAKIVTFIALITLQCVQHCSAEEEFSKFWHTCDIALDSNVDRSNEHCSRAYNNKALSPEVFELYKNEAELFYEFRNKLTAIERGQVEVCEFVDKDGELLDEPVLFGYNLENRIKLYQKGQLQNCYLNAQDHVEFMKCLIELRTKMIEQLDKMAQSDKKLRKY